MERIQKNNMNMHLVITTFNRPKSLKQTLLSVERVNLSEEVKLTVYVVDNNSTDDTKKIVEGLIKKFRFDLRYLHENEPGKIHALNKAIKAIEEGIVLITDDDVEIHEDWIQNMANNFQNKNVDAVTGRIISRVSVETPNWYSDKLATVIGDVGWSENRAPALWMTGANGGIRKEVFDRIGLFENLKGLINEDIIFSQKIREHGFRIMYDPDVIIYHYFQPDRFRKNYFYRWYWLSGKAISEVCRKNDIHEKRSFLRIPLWRYREFFGHLKGFFVGLRNAKERFYHYVQMIRFFGFCSRRWFVRRKK